MGPSYPSGRTALGATNVEEAEAKEEEKEGLTRTMTRGRFGARATSADDNAAAGADCNEASATSVRGAGSVFAALAAASL